MENRVSSKDELLVNKKRVVVAGDLVMDNNLAHNPTVTTEYYEISKNIVNNPQKGGAWYLKEIIDLACSGLGAEIVMPQDPDNISSAYQLWARYEQEIGSRQKVWRIREFLGCEPIPQEKQKEFCPDRLHDTDVLVLDNIGLGFFGKYDKLITNLKKTNKIQDIILKVSALPENTSSSNFLNDLFRECADRLTIVLSADALRKRGAAVSTGLSCDLAIEEISKEFEKGLSSHDLAKCKRCIVHYEHEGAACFVRRGDMKHAQLEHFLYDPRKCEGAFRAKRPGTIFGTSTFITASMVRYILAQETYPLFIAAGRALAAARVNYRLGGGTENNLKVKESNDAIKKIFINYCTDEKEIKEMLCFAEKEPAAIFSSSFRHDVLSKPSIRKDKHSDLLQDLTGDGIEYVMAKAFEIVQHGMDKALKNVPMACYGKYQTADREEIERINAIKNLILQYQENKNDYRPLSIAVFGAPGSGKSFAIKQLSEELFGQTKSILEFNLSQFRSPEEIHTAFHQIRDATIRGQIPIVFWDEFDSHNLNWLKEFLAPIQDARFTAGNITHPFGKAIFVFAGGTHETFESFNSAGEDKTFKEAKGPDFVSRLRGFINIKGPNPASQFAGKDTGKNLAREQLPDEDTAHLIRRAIMLRIIIERSHPHLIKPETGMASISSSVIHGFLRAGKFLHGARSLEAIVVMSKLVNVRHYGVAQLPTKDLLQLHVTPDFLEHVQEGQMEIPLIEAVAEACHEGWRKQKEKDGYVYGKERNDDESKGKKTHPLLIDYDKLSEPGKEGNRTTARRTPAKLHEIGYEIRRINEIEKKDIVKKFPEDRFNQLVKIEHDIWLREKLIQGYAYAEKTNDDLRLHRCVERFENLTPEDKSLDEAIVDSLIPVLDEHKYGIVETKIHSGAQPQSNPP